MYRRGEVSNVIIPTANLDEWMTNPELKDQVRPDKLGTYTYFYTFNFEPKFDAEYEPENWKLAVNNSNFRKSIVSAFNRVAANATEDPYNPEYRIINTITPPNFASQNGLDYTQYGNLKDLRMLNFIMKKKLKNTKIKQ